MCYFTIKKLSVLSSCRVSCLSKLSQVVQVFYKYRIASVPDFPCRVSCRVSPVELRSRPGVKNDRRARTPRRSPGAPNAERVRGSAYKAHERDQVAAPVHYYTRTRRASHARPIMRTQPLQTRHLNTVHLNFKIRSHSHSSERRTYIRLTAAAPSGCSLASSAAAPGRFI